MSKTCMRFIVYTSRHYGNIFKQVLKKWLSYQRGKVSDWVFFLNIHCFFQVYNFCQALLCIQMLYISSKWMNLYELVNTWYFSFFFIKLWNWKLNKNKQTCGCNRELNAIIKIYFNFNEVASIYFCTHHYK